MMKEMVVSCFMLGFFFLQENQMYANAYVPRDHVILQWNSDLSKNLANCYENCKTMLEEEKKKNFGIADIMKSNENLFNELLKKLNPVEGKETISCLSIVFEKLPGYRDTVNKNKNKCIDEKWKEIENEYKYFEKKINKTRRKYEKLNSKLNNAEKDVKGFCIKNSMDSIKKNLNESRDEFNGCIENSGTVSMESFFQIQESIDEEGLGVI